MLKSFVSVFILLLTLGLQVRANEPIKEVEGTLDLTTFERKGDFLVWPHAYLEEPPVAVYGSPNITQIEGTKIVEYLDTSIQTGGGGYVSNRFGSELKVTFGIEILTPFTWMICSTSDGQQLIVLDPGGPQYLDVITPMGGIPDIHCNFGGQGGQAKLSFEQIVVKLPSELPECHCKLKVSANSSLNINSSSLSEEIPLTGVPFDLGYSSNWIRSLGPDIVNPVGLGGWLPSILKRFSGESSTLVFGDGSQIKVDFKEIEDGVYAVVSTDGLETYIFNESAQHLRTLENTLGTDIYTFGYSTDGKITSITDRFGKSTTFAYSGSTVTMTSPLGQITTLTLDANGFLTAVRNPNNETYHITNSATGQLLAFQKPAGQTSQVVYDPNGFVISDTGAGGDSIQLSKTYDWAMAQQTSSKTTAMGRVNSYTIFSRESTHMESQETTPFGGVSQMSHNDLGDSYTTDIYGNQSLTSTSEDPRFSAFAPYVSYSKMVVPNSSIAIEESNDRTASAVNDDEPFALASFTETTIKQNDPSRTSVVSFDGPSRTYTYQSAMNRVSYQTLNAQALTASTQVANLTPTTFGYDSFGRLTTRAQGGRVQSNT